MVKYLIFILLLMFLILSINGQAQLSLNVKNYPENNIKTNPLNLAFGNLNISYERMMDDYQSLNFRLKGSFYAPFKNKIDGTSIDPGSWYGRFTSAPKYTAIGADAEYRFYNKNKKGPQGFYVAPYLRVNHYTAQTGMQYIGMLNGSARDIMGNLYLYPTRIGTGVQLGAQWLINKKVTIDWSFFGIGADLWMIKGKIKSAGLIGDYPQMQQDLHGYLNRRSYFGSRSRISGDELSARTNLILPGFKSALTVGIAF